MDLRVYVSFVLTFLFACALTFYKAVYASCTVPEIEMDREIAEAGTEILFSNVGDSRELEWDFGDGSPVKKGVRVQHTYVKDGLVLVSADYNDECVAEISINVQPQKRSGPEVILPTVDFPREVRVNEPANFRDFTSGATAWEWFVVGGTKDQISGMREFNTRFRKPGTYVVNLKVTGENMEGRRELTLKVLASDKSPSSPRVENHRPPPPPPSTLVEGIELDRSEFLQVCMDYNSKDNSKKRRQRDRFAELIRNHFAGGLATSIKLEGAEDLEVSNPDLLTLSKTLYMYRVTSIQLVPAGGMYDKNGFRQYKTMTISIEKL